MELTVVRFAFGVNATIGVLTVDGGPVCYTLEDADRLMVGLPKIKARTAIPAGQYPLAVTFSPRFKCQLPEIQDVPDFTGVRVHWGNRPEDTEGCLLVGVSANVRGWFITESRKAFADCYGIFPQASQITITRAPSSARVADELRRQWLLGYVTGGGTV